MSSSSQTYTLKIKEIRNSFDKKLINLARKMRREIVIPLCEEHGLIFHAGLTRVYFQKDNTFISPELSPQLLRQYQLEECFSLLRSAIFFPYSTRMLGEYMNGYVPMNQRKS